MGVFDRVERSLERSVKGAFNWAFKAEVEPIEIGTAVRRAMDEGRKTLGKSHAIAPNVFTVELATTDYERLSTLGEQLEQELVAVAQQHAEDQRYRPFGEFQIILSESDELETGVFRVRHSSVKTAPPKAAPAAVRPGYAPPKGAPERDARPARRRGPVDRPWLELDGDHYPLLGTLTVLGRDPACDIVIDDTGISRRHVEIRVTSDGPNFVTNVRDLGSTNGTFVNGERISTARLEDRDLIALGRSRFTYHSGRR